MVKFNKFRCLAFWLFFLHSFCSTLTEEFSLTYYSDQDISISNSVVQQGSYADLGIYPHWCIANIDKCTDGLSLEFWMNPKPAFDNSPKVTILTNGGHTFFSDGVYLVQQFGDQYEFGVTKQSNIWKVNFRLIPGFWTHLVLLWSEKVGLSVYVDDKLFRKETSEKRKHIPYEFDPFSRMLIGLDGNGDPLTSQKLFQIRNVTMYDKIVDKDIFNTDLELIYLGCDLVNNDAVNSGNLITNSSITIKECRKSCNAMGYPFVRFKENFGCNCVPLDKLPKYESCQSSDVWKLYVVSCVNERNPYNMEITVEKLQKRNYVKPLETVKILIKTDVMSNVSFHVDFDDGIVLYTTENSFSHFWQREGNFTISFTSELGILNFGGNTTFEVQDIDEGIKPEMVLISGIHENRQMFGEFELVVSDKEDTGCAINFTDGSLVKTFSFNTEYTSIQTLDHEFPTFGGYHILAQCQNSYGKTINETLFVSKKFEVPFMYYPKGANFTFFSAGGNEFNLKQAKVFRNNENESLSAESSDKGDISISSLHLKNFENLLTYKTDGVDIMQTILFVENVLGKPSISVDTKDSAWNLTTNISVTIPKGNHIFINCSFGVGDDRLFYIDESDKVTHLVFEIQYIHLGYYPLQVTLSNDLSHEIVEGLISVEVPIETISLSTSNITDKTLPVVLQIDLNIGITGPDKVKFDIDYDDGNTMTYDYRSPTSFFTKYKAEYTYKDWGIYYICVKAYNQITFVRSCTLVQVGQNITYIDVQTHTTGRVTTIEYAEIDITSITGSDLTYLVNFGDGHPFVFTDRQLIASTVVMSNDSVSTVSIVYTSAEIGNSEFVENNSTTSHVVNETDNSVLRSKRDTGSTSDARSKATRSTPTLIKVYHIYTKTGRYHVDVRISNKFSTKWTSLCTDIHVDNTDITQCDQPSVTFMGIQSTFENPIVRVRSLEIPIIVDATSNCSNQFTYDWKGIEFIDNLKVPVDSLCHNDYNDNVFRIPAVLLTFGLYKLTVTIAPKGYIRNAAQRDVFLQIIPSYPYAEFSGENEEWVLVYESTTLDLSSSRDPDFDNRVGLQFDIFCSLKQEFAVVDGYNLQTLSTIATPVYEDVTFKRDTDNIIKLYQYGKCFEVEDNSTDEFTAVKGKLNFPSEFFIQSATDFSFKLFVTKEGRINSTYKHIEVRMSNASSLADLVNNLDNIQDAAGMIRAVSSITKNLDTTNDNSTDATEQRTQFREKMAKNMKRVCGTENSPKQAKSTMKVLETVTKNSDEVSQNTRMDSSDAVMKSADNLKNKFEEEDMSEITDAATAALSAASNVIPKPNTEELELLNLMADTGDEEDDGNDDILGETDSESDRGLYSSTATYESTGENTELYDGTGGSTHEWYMMKTTQGLAVGDASGKTSVNAKIPTSTPINDKTTTNPQPVTTRPELSSTFQSNIFTDYSSTTKGPIITTNAYITTTSLSNYENSITSPGSNLGHDVNTPGSHQGNGENTPGSNQGNVITTSGSNQGNNENTPGSNQGNVITTPGSNQGNNENTHGANQEDGVNTPGSNQGNGVNTPGSNNGNGVNNPNNFQSPSQSQKYKSKMKRRNAEQFLFKEYDLVKEGDGYHKILKTLKVRHSDELMDFYKCLFSSKVVTRNAFVGAVREFREKMNLPEDILKMTYTQIFKWYIWEWEPFDIQKYINKYCKIIEGRLDDERKNADKNVAGSVMGAVDSLAGLMLGKKAKEKKKNNTDTADDDDPPMKLKAKGMELQMQTVSKNATGKKQLGSASGGLKLSPDLLPSTDNNCSVGVKVLVNDDNQYTYGQNSKDIKTSLVSVDFSDPCSDKKFNVSDTKEPLEIAVAGKPEDVPDPAISKLCIQRTASPDDPRYFYYHSVNLTANDTTIHFTIWPEADGDVFELYVKYQDQPNATYYDYKTTVPKDKAEFPGVEEGEKLEYMRHTFFPPPIHTKYNGTYRIAVKVRKRDRYDFQEDKVCLNYTSTMVVASCKFWDEEQKIFRGDGCTVGNETTKWSTQCWCTHLTSFGGDFVVPPNTIDFNTVWSKFDVADNPAVFSTVIALIGLYIITVIWARKKDKLDIIKWGATPLEDNLPSDNYHYQVTVYTGTRKNASTKSNVSVVLSGDECDTGVRRLYDGIRKDFPKGSIYNFILSVENPLGQLSFLRVWHDNSGRGKLKSWYLDQVQVTDLQTGERFFFLCDRWLAVEEDDGMVDRIIPVAGLEDLAAFKQLFSSSAKKKLTSDHLWFSVFSRPTRSSFTRVQRISCCMSLLFMTMITNAMWYKTGGDPNQKTTTLKMGPFSFTMQQLFISFASTMLVFPVNFILITFFRRCRQKKNTIMQKNQQVPKKGKWKSVSNGSQLWGSKPKRTKWRKFKDAIDELITSHQRRRKYANEDFDDVQVEEAPIPEPRIAGDPDGEKTVKEKRKKKPKTLPYWCIYIAWGLCFLSIGLSGFFTILYSMEWGREKANEWLTTFLLSFFQSVIVVQPIKVMAIVAFIACILKKPDLDEEDGGEELNNVIMAHDEEMLKKSTSDINEIATKRKEANLQFKPPDAAELEKARRTRINELKMEAVFKELSVYVIFVLILFFLSYQQRDSDSFTYAENLKTYLGSGFDSIMNVDQYWAWLEKKLIPALYATHYPDGTRMRRWWNKRCISDMVSRRVGIPRLRQLRVKDNSCKVNPLLSSVIKHCRDEYGWTDDDTKAYLPNWVDPPKENISALEKEFNPWVYQNSIKLKSAPYVGTIGTYKGGGYSILFEREINRTTNLILDLKNQIWMDANTRAIFLEFTVYNPNINLFGSMIMVIEFMHSGGATQRMEFKIFRLLSYVGGLGILVLIAEILYACFILFFLVRFINKLRKEKLAYFKSFWNKLEFALLVFSCAVVAMYAFKQILTAVTLKALKDSSKADYVNFQSMALYDEMYGWMCAFVVFLATVQFLKLLQFNKKMNMLGDTISLSAKDLKVFSITCTIYIWTFISTGYLLFGKDLLDYASLINSAEALFSFALGAFDFEAMNHSNKILGPLFFFAFIAVVYIGLMSMFLTILADAFTQVKENFAKQSNDYELLDFMIKRLKGVMGFKQN